LSRISLFHLLLNRLYSVKILKLYWHYLIQCFRNPDLLDGRWLSFGATRC
jgi:hypothetical protein